jgi:hypothetical protein|tara:strand:+ start:335 stop:514 length:180 start_codon:yes stop_codon:yes gene_type:complete
MGNSIDFTWKVIGPAARTVGMFCMVMAYLLGAMEVGKRARLLTGAPGSTDSKQRKSAKP